MLGNSRSTFSQATSIAFSHLIGAQVARGKFGAGLTRWKRKDRVGFGCQTAYAYSRNYRGPGGTGQIGITGSTLGESVLDQWTQWDQWAPLGSSVGSGYLIRSAVEIPGWKGSDMPTCTFIPCSRALGDSNGR